MEDNEQLIYVATGGRRPMELRPSYRQLPQQHRPPRPGIYRVEQISFAEFFNKREPITRELLRRFRDLEANWPSRMLPESIAAGGSLRMFVWTEQRPAPTTHWEQVCIRMPFLADVPGARSWFMRNCRAQHEEFVEGEATKRCSICGSQLFGYHIHDHSQEMCPFDWLRGDDRLRFLAINNPGFCSLCNSRSAYHKVGDCKPKKCTECNEDGHTAATRLCRDPRGFDTNESRAALIDDVTRFRYEHLRNIQDLLRHPDHPLLYRVYNDQAFWHTLDNRYHDVHARFTGWGVYLDPRYLFPRPAYYLYGNADRRQPTEYHNMIPPELAPTNQPAIPEFTQEVSVYLDEIGQILKEAKITRDENYLQTVRLPNINPRALLEAAAIRHNRDNGPVGPRPLRPPPVVPMPIQQFPPEARRPAPPQVRHADNIPAHHERFEDVVQSDEESSTAESDEELEIVHVSSPDSSSDEVDGDVVTAREGPAFGFAQFALPAPPADEDEAEEVREVQLQREVLESCTDPVFWKERDETMSRGRASFQQLAYASIKNQPMPRGRDARITRTQTWIALLTGNRVTRDSIREHPNDEIHAYCQRLEHIAWRLSTEPMAFITLESRDATRSLLKNNGGSDFIRVPTLELCQRNTDLVDFMEELTADAEILNKFGNVQRTFFPKQNFQIDSTPRMEAAMAIDTDEDVTPRHPENREFDIYTLRAMANTRIPWSAVMMNLRLRWVFRYIIGHEGNVDFREGDNYTRGTRYWILVMGVVNALIAFRRARRTIVVDITDDLETLFLGPTLTPTPTLWIPSVELFRSQEWAKWQPWLNMSWLVTLNAMIHENIGLDRANEAE